jgi:DNA-binding transcriptional regulator YdaS (Cro superfamily)
MKLSEYFKQVRGRQTQLAKEIKAKAPDLSKWASGKKPIPLHHGSPIESATHGLVTREDMFPDSWQIHWPELKRKRRNTHVTPS